MSGIPRLSGWLRSAQLLECQQQKGFVMRSFLVASLAASLVAAPVAAAVAGPAPPAGPLSLQGARAGPELQDPQALDGNWWIIGLGILAILFLVIVLDEDDEVESP